jgi:hypothetical protein
MTPAPLRFRPQREDLPCLELRVPVKKDKRSQLDNTFDEEQALLYDYVPHGLTRLQLEKERRRPYLQLLELCVTLPRLLYKAGRSPDCAEPPLTFVSVRRCSAFRGAQAAAGGSSCGFHPPSDTLSEAEEKEKGNKKAKKK